MVDSACKYPLAIIPPAPNRMESMRSVVIEYRPQAVSTLEESVVTALQRGDRVVLDLDAVEVLTTAGVRDLITLLRSARAAGGELTLRSGKASVRRTLEVTALDRIFTLEGSEAA
jgi:anti-anti-sigma factor